MGKKKYEVKKVYDCQDMPDKVMRSFFDSTDCGNDVYVDWTVGGHEEYETEEEYEENRDDDFKAVDKWLIKNGAEGDEEVIIKHWW